MNGGKKLHYQIFLKLKNEVKYLRVEIMSEYNNKKNFYNLQREVKVDKIEFE